MKTRYLSKSRNNLSDDLMFVAYGIAVGMLRCCRLMGLSGVFHGVDVSHLDCM